MTTTAISLKLDSELKEKIQKKAAENGISMSAFISLVLTNAVEDFSVNIGGNYRQKPEIYDPDFIRMVAESRASYDAKSRSYKNAQEAFDDILGKD